MLKLILHLIRGPLRSRESLILENVALRHQLQVLSRGRKRPALKNQDRMVWIFLRRIWKGWRKPLVIVQPETVIRWHRWGFRAFWTRKSRRQRHGRVSWTAPIGSPNGSPVNKQAFIGENLRG